MLKDVEGKLEEFGEELDWNLILTFTKPRKTIWHTFVTELDAIFILTLSMRTVIKVDLYVLP